MMKQEMEVFACRRHCFQLVMPIFRTNGITLFIHSFINFRYARLVTTLLLLLQVHRHFSNFGCDGLVRPAPLRLSEMILSQGGAWIGSRSPLPGSAKSRQTRFTTRQGRKLSSVTVLGVPEQSAGLLFKGGASGDVGSFSAPVGMFVARISQGSITRSRNMSKHGVVIAGLPVRRR